jgi:succinate dehydrogenase/fumarate reductase flavoprotein subunit
LLGAAAEIGAVSDRLTTAAHPGSAPARGGRGAGELANLVTVSGALLRAATAREETRGAHARRDFPEARSRWCCRLVHRHHLPPSTP